MNCVLKWVEICQNLVDRKDLFRKYGMSNYCLANCGIFNIVRSNLSPNKLIVKSFYNTC